MAAHSSEFGSSPVPDSALFLQAAGSSKSGGWMLKRLNSSSRPGERVLVDGTVSALNDAAITGEVILRRVSPER
jgi:hypothetical protein